MQDDVYEEPIIETGIPCFRCGERSGMEAPGRKPDEPTLCTPCFETHMAEEMKKQAIHQASYLLGVRACGGFEEAVRVFGKVFCEEEREGIRNLIGDAAIFDLLNFGSSWSAKGSMEEQARHLASYLDGVRDCGGDKRVRDFWGYLSEEDRECARKILGDAWVERILS